MPDNKPQDQLLMERLKKRYDPYINLRKSLGITAKSDIGTADATPSDRGATENQNQPFNPYKAAGLPQNGGPADWSGLKNAANTISDFIDQHPALTSAMTAGVVNPFSNPAFNPRKIAEFVKERGPAISGAYQKAAESGVGKAFGLPDVRAMFGASPAVPTTPEQPMMDQGEPSTPPSDMYNQPPPKTEPPPEIVNKFPQAAQAAQADNALKDQDYEQLKNMIQTSNATYRADIQRMSDEVEQQRPDLFSPGNILYMLSFGPQKWLERHDQQLEQYRNRRSQILHLTAQGDMQQAHQLLGLEHQKYAYNQRAKIAAQGQEAKSNKLGGSGMGIVVNRMMSGMQKAFPSGPIDINTQLPFDEKVLSSDKKNPHFNYIPSRGRSINDTVGSMVKDGLLSQEKAAALLQFMQGKSVKDVQAALGNQ